MRSDQIRVGIVGVGNCASSLVQGLTYYADVPNDNEPIPGLMHVDLGGYLIRDIAVSAAFDVSASKVGRDVSEAIFASPNNTRKFADVRPTGVQVSRGRTLDGIGKYLKDEIQESNAPVDDVAEILRQTGTDVLISYLPVGSEEATKWYAEQALAAGCAFINCIPVFIASKPEWRRRFAERGLPLIGDDIKSQVGATIVHRMLVNLFRERGVRVDRTYQLNFGGNTDFLNMLERERLESKKISKTRSVTSQLDVPLAANDIHVGPSDHVPWLEDRKWAYIRLEGTTFGGVPEDVLMDNPRALVVRHDAVSRSVQFNDKLLAFAKHWGFRPVACALYRARTKGKTESGVGYVKKNAIAGHCFASWEAFEAHLARWEREVANVRTHGTTGEAPIARFEHAEAHRLKALGGRPSAAQALDEGAVEEGLHDALAVLGRHTPVAQRDGAREGIELGVALVEPVEPVGPEQPTRHHVGPLTGRVAAQVTQVEHVLERHTGGLNRGGHGRSLRLAPCGPSAWLSSSVRSCSQPAASQPQGPPPIRWRRPRSVQHRRPRLPRPLRTSRSCRPRQDLRTNHRRVAPRSPGPGPAG